MATATARLQEAWALPPLPPPEPPPPPKPGAKPVDPSKGVVPLTHLAPPRADPCADTARLALGWRIGRFGAAWRETAQAVRVAAERLRSIRGAPTVSPLVDGGWATALDALAARAVVAEATWREASAWQARYVRPTLQACPVPPLGAAPGFPVPVVRARGEEEPMIAVLALGDGWVCPSPQRADDAVVLVEGPQACWSASTPCACEPVDVAPGAVLAPP